MAAKIELIVRGVLRHGSEVLLCRSRRGGYSYLPGGHVEFGEPAVAALVREFREETGLEVRGGSFIVAEEHFFTQGQKQRHELNLLFHVELLPTERPEVVSLEEDLSFEWVRAEDLAAANLRPSGHSPYVSAVQGLGGRWASVGA